MVKDTVALVVAQPFYRIGCKMLQAPLQTCQKHASLLQHVSCFCPLLKQTYVQVNLSKVDCTAPLQVDRCCAKNVLAKQKASQSNSDNTSEMRNVIRCSTHPWLTKNAAQLLQKRFLTKVCPKRPDWNTCVTCVSVFVSPVRTARMAQVSRTRPLRMVAGLVDLGPISFRGGRYRTVGITPSQRRRAAAGELPAKSSG